MAAILGAQVDDEKLDEIFCRGVASVDFAVTDTTWPELLGHRLRTSNLMRIFVAVWVRSFCGDQYNIAKVVGHRLTTENLAENFRCDVCKRHLAVTNKSWPELLGHALTTETSMKFFVVLSRNILQ